MCEARVRVLKPHLWISQAYLLMTLLWTTFRTMILCVQSFRNSVNLVFKAALVSCLATIFRLSHDALQRLSSWARFSASTSKSTWKHKPVGQSSPSAFWEITNQV